MDERKAPPQYSSESEHIPRPAGWMYKSSKIGKFSTSWYASPRIQLGMVAFVCFLCPGMFNALSGLGGGGKADHSLADKMVRFAWDFCFPLISPHSFHLILRHSDLVVHSLTTTEHRTVQYIRRSGFLRRNIRQPSRRASFPLIRRNRLLHLLH